jgi:hypothetical protein
MLGSSICVLARFASPHGSNCIKPHKLFRIHRAKLIAPIAAPPIIPPVVWLTSPLLNPKTRLAISTESFTIPAQRALLISLLPHQYQGDISRKASHLLPLSSVFPPSAVIKRPPTTPSRIPIIRTKNECSVGTLYECRPQV